MRPKNNAKIMLNKTTEPHTRTPEPVTWSRFAPQCWEGLGPIILIDDYANVTLTKTYIIYQWFPPGFGFRTETNMFVGCDTNRWNPGKASEDKPLTSKGL